MPVVYKPNSPYRQTPFKDFYLDLWNKPDIPVTEEDQRITIGADVERRPDLLASRLYGTPSLWWVFAIRNPDILIDPVEDFIAGTEIFIPQAENLRVG
jgi:hypothetical protein